MFFCLSLPHVRITCVPYRARSEYLLKGKKNFKYDFWLIQGSFLALIVSEQAAIFLKLVIQLCLKSNTASHQPPGIKAQAQNKPDSPLTVLPCPKKILGNYFLGHPELSRNRGLQPGLASWIQSSEIMWLKERVSFNKLSVFWPLHCSPIHTGKPKHKRRNHNK